LQCRDEPEHECRPHDDQNGEDDRPSAELQLHPRRDLVGAQRDEEMHQPATEYRAEHTGHEGQRETLGDQLAAYALRAGA
jgi:hypothetical protein